MNCSRLLLRRLAGETYSASPKRSWPRVGYERDAHLVRAKVEAVDFGGSDRYNRVRMDTQNNPPAEEEASEKASSDSIRLDAYLKLTGRARSGGEAKHRIQAGDVLVNGVMETHRSRKIRVGDRVTLNGETSEVEIPDA